jgi:hypothetical protein
MAQRHTRFYLNYHDLPAWGALRLKVMELEQDICIDGKPADVTSIVPSNKWCSLAITANSNFWVY